MYRAMMISTVKVAARPGTFSGSVVSSFMVKVTSQPQKMKMDRLTPAAKAVKDSTAAGLNISRVIGVRSKGSGLVKHMIANNSSTATWKPTSTYWNALVAFSPR